MAVTGRAAEVRSLAFKAFLFTIIASGCCSSQVPFLMWTSDGYSLPPIAPPAAGHITSNSQLVSYLKSALGSAPHNVLLFLQDKLSKDDFTVFGGVFGNKQDSAFPNIEAALQSSSSLVLPSLAWPDSNSIPALLQESLGVSPVLVDPDSLSHLSLNASGSNLLIINLPYNTDSFKSCKEVLQSNDEVIGKALSILKEKNVPYTAIYTGLQPSRVISETFMVNKPAGRSLLQASADTTVKPPIIFNGSSGPCIMLWAEGMNVSLDGAETWIDLAAQNYTTTGSVCNDTYSQLVLNYGAGITLSFLMTQRLYPVSGRRWFTLDTVQLQANDTVAAFSGSHNIYAPVEYSFHCQSVNSIRQDLLVPNITSVEAIPVVLNFIDFQIQGFSLGNSTNFAYASDCAGFFTPGIWMGLVTGLLMVLILVYGLHMIMQLNTMDRFDDPKGPSISVPQSE